MATRRKGREILLRALSEFSFESSKVSPQAWCHRD
jgi:hypothetical protein